MAGIVEFIVKMQDGMTAPLQKMSSHSNQANQSLQKLTASNKQLTGMIAGTSSSVTTLNSRINKLKELRDILPADAEHRIRSVNKEILSLNQQIERLQKVGTGGGLKQMLGNAFGSLPAFLKNPFVLAGAGLTAAINTGLKNSSEKLDYQLLLGKDAGSAFFQSVKKAAPAGMRESYIEGGKQLLSSGQDTKAVNKTLDQIGNISSGKSDNFAGILSAFTSVRKEGKLTESSLQQLNVAGFKPLVVLNRATGESMENLRKRFEAGKISVKDIEKAFEAATGKGGEFEGRLKQLNESPLGKWDLFKTKVLDLSSSFGDALLPVFSKGIDLLSVGFDWLNIGIDWTVKVLSDLSEWLDRNSVLMYALAGAVLGGVVAYKTYQAVSMLIYLWQMRDLVSTSLLATAKGALTIVTGGLTIAQNALSAAFIASPIGWVVLGLGALTAGVVYAWNKFEGFRKVIFGLWDAFKEVFNSIGALFKKIFSPIGEALSAIQDGRWKDAVKATGKLLYNISIGGVLDNTISFIKDGGFKNVKGGYERGSDKGKESYKKSKSKKEKQDEMFSSPESKLYDYLKKSDTKPKADPSSQSGINAVSGGGAKNVSITVKTMFDNTSIVVQNGAQQVAREIQRQVEESTIRALASASGR